MDQPTLPEAAGADGRVCFVGGYGETGLEKIVAVFTKSFFARISVERARAGLDDGDGSLARDELTQQAVMLGVEMLDEHEGHAGVRREVAEQFRDGFETAGGSSDGDDQEIRVGTTRAVAVALRSCCSSRLRLHRVSQQPAANPA
jgi:hypothetical protein